MDTTAAPRELHIVDELPLRGIGKVDRRALAERFG
jgi:O-succinylbenzoic acid--CoA ligase